MFNEWNECFLQADVILRCCVNDSFFQKNILPLHQDERPR